MPVQQQSAPVEQAAVPDGGPLILRLGPVVVYGGPGRSDWAQAHTSVLAWLQANRLRCFNDRRPDPECVLDVDVTSYDLDLTRMPRDRTVTVTSSDGTITRLVVQAGGCACQGGSMLRGWAPSS